MPHATSTLRTKLMQQLLHPERMRFQRLLALVDDHVLPPWEYQQVPVLEADGAVAAPDFMKWQRG